MTDQARYLYGVVGGSHEDRLGPIGLDGAEVYVVPHRDLSVAVHACGASPYDSDHLDRVRAWVLAHQRVVNQVMNSYGAVLPLGFNTLVCGAADEEKTDQLRGWLEENRDDLSGKLRWIRDRREYGVQVFCDLHAMTEQVTDTAEVRRLAADLATRGKGTAYLLGHQLEASVREEVDKTAASLARETLGLFRETCVDLVADEVWQTEGDERMLLNLSVLLDPAREGELGKLLDEVAERRPLSARFTGPWAPYSFMRAP